VQRGHNRAPCFFASGDRDRYLSLLHEFAAHHVCRIHAYVLMTNHVHLVLSPRDPADVTGLMKSVNQRYVQYINRKYERIGSLWAGRFRSSIVDTDLYFLTCQRYVELNAVRAGIVSHPAQYPWSSFRANAWGFISPVVDPHDLFLALGPTGESRRSSYRALFEQEIHPDLLNRIRFASRTGCPIGSEAFVNEVGRQLGRRSWARAPGRPKKASDEGREQASLCF
jgi:putative transposase